MKPLGFRFGGRTPIPSTASRAAFGSLLILVLGTAGCASRSGPPGIGGKSESSAALARSADRCQADRILAQARWLATAGRWDEAAPLLEQAHKLSLAGQGSAIPAEVGLWEYFRQSPIGVFHFAHRPTRLAFSPDTKLALTGDDQGGVVLWDLATGYPRLTIPAHTNWVSHLAFSADGRLAVSQSHGDAIKLWNLETGRQLGSFRCAAEQILAVAIVPAAGGVVAACGDGTMRVISIKTGQETRRITNSLIGTVTEQLAGGGTSQSTTGEVACVSFSADGQRALAGTRDGGLRLWDVLSGREIQSFAGHAAWISGLAISSDGRQVLSGASDGTVRLWDVATGREHRSFAGQTGWVSPLAFGRADQLVLTGDNEGTVQVWNPATYPERISILKVGSDRGCLAFSADGRLALSGGPADTVRLWDLTPGRGTRVFNGIGLQWVASAQQDSWKNDDGQPSLWVRPSFSSDGRWAVTPNSGHPEVLLLWDVATGLFLAPLRGPTNAVAAVAFSPDAHWLASSRDDGSVQLWDVAAGSIVRAWQAGTNLVSGVAFSPDARSIATADCGGHLRFWKAGTGEPAGILTNQPTDRAWCLFSPDGRRIAGPDGADSCQVWELESARRIAAFKGLPGAFSHDGRQLLLAREAEPDQAVSTLCDLATGRELRAFRGMGAGFSPDGRLIFGLGLNNRCTGWDIDSGFEVFSVPWHDYWDLFAMAWLTPDRLVTMGIGGHWSEALMFGSLPSVVEVYDFSRGATARELESKVAAAHRTLSSNPKDAGSLATLGEWYALQDSWDWAIELLERARTAGARISAITLARCHWQRATARWSAAQPDRTASDYAGVPEAVTQAVRDDLAHAAREFQRAIDQHEAPPAYLKLCMAAVKGGIPPAGK